MIGEKNGRITMTFDDKIIVIGISWVIVCLGMMIHTWESHNE